MKLKIRRFLVEKAEKKYRVVVTKELRKDGQVNILTGEVFG